MSPDEDALLNGIAADPAADLPRLVYADWLEEHGRELRAEFIRLQCEIARLEVGPRAVIEQNVHLWRRQQELLDGHLEELLDGVQLDITEGHRSDPRFYRGFIDELRVDQHEFNESHEVLANLRPRPSRLELTAQPFMFFTADLVPEKAVSRVTVLTIDGSRDNGHESMPFCVWPNVKVLTALNSPLFGDELLGFVTDCFPALEALNLPFNQLTDGDVMRLLDSGLLHRLSHIAFYHNRIGDQAAIELADRLGRSTKLKELDLRYNGIERAGQQALLARFGSKVILF